MIYLHRFLSYNFEKIFTFISILCYFIVLNRAFLHQREMQFISIYNQTNGDNWIQFRIYHIDPYYWYGVKLENGVVEPNLSGQAT